MLVLFSRFGHVNYERSKSQSCPIYIELFHESFLDIFEIFHHNIQICGIKNANFPTVLCYLSMFIFYDTVCVCCF